MSAEWDAAFYAEHYGPESGWTVHEIPILVRVPGKRSAADSLALIVEILDEASFDISVERMAEHDDAVRAEERAKHGADVAALEAILAEAIAAHRSLHHTYANTSVCWGGIGGQAMTQHGAVTCGNPTHEPDTQRWREVERAYFDRASRRAS